MATPLRPEPERKPQRLDPTILARSVIALPLLEQINEELAVTRRITALDWDLGKTRNVAIFLKPALDHPLGTSKALEELKKLLDKAVDKLKPESEQEFDVSLDPDLLQSGKFAAPARLDGPVIRYLLKADLASKSSRIDHIWPSRFEVIIDINLAFKPLESKREHRDPRQAAKDRIKKYVEQAKKDQGVTDADQGVDEKKTDVTNQYVFARLQGSVIKRLVEIDENAAKKLVKEAEAASPQVIQKAVGRKGKATARAVEAAPKVEISRFRTIHHIWPDFDISSCITNSIRTVKVDAAQRSFTALGNGITWAVMDSGIDGLHPHFKLHGNIDPASPYHDDFTDSPGGEAPLTDDYGHGTHVAGIIAGEQSQKEGSEATKMIAVWQERDSNGNPVSHSAPLKAISGMAPQCKLVSLKVLDEFGIGKASNIIAAIAHVQIVNGHGRDLKIHGVNLSLGHPFDPMWFACGHSPLCVEVNRLVKSGVVVVVAAGNTGYGSLETKEGSSDACLDLTINDPGNAEYAITVGSTHRDLPHRYGVSFFSSKGPTGDGRYKPDLIAPGEKIISCAAPNSALVRRESEGVECYYIENSGTSMAAPHVSGAIAAFLSIRGEFIGEAEKVKQIFTSTATDLGRDRYFQGAGLVDLMRAIQSV